MGVWVGAIRTFFDERTAAVAVMAAGIFIGILVPALSIALEPIALPALFLVVVFSLAPFARLDLRDLLAFDPMVVRIVATQQLLLPSLVASIGVIAELPDYVIVLTIVTACSGAVFASPAIASLLKLDQRRALHSMILSTLIMPLSLAFFLGMHNGENVDLDLVTYSKRVATFLLVPFALFLMFRFFARRLDDRATQQLEVSSRWAMVASLLVFGIGIMHPLSDQLAANPAKVAFYLGLATLLSIGMMMTTVVVMYRYGMNLALTAGIVSGLRNVGLGFALVGDMVGPELAVYVGVSMLPVFMTPFAVRLATARRAPATDPAVEDDMGPVTRAIIAS